MEVCFQPLLLSHALPCLYCLHPVLPLRPPASPPERYVFQRVSAYKKNLPRYKKSQTTEYEAANAFSPEPGYFLLCFHPSCNEPAQLIQEKQSAEKVQAASAGSSRLFLI